MLYWLKLRRIRMREQKKLDKINLKTLKKIIEYIRNSNLQYHEREEALHQVLDIMLQSQAEERSADVIIGDYEAFCKSIIEEYTKDKSTVYTILHHFQRAIMNMIIIIVPTIVTFKILYPKMDTGISAYLLISSIGIAFILMPFSHNTKQRKWASIIYFTLTMAAISFVSSTSWGEIIDSVLIPNTNAILMGVIFIAAAIEVYKRVSDRNAIRNDRC
jgi:DNA-binding ferritin-like protein (Dps family)